VVICGERPSAPNLREGYLSGCRKLPGQLQNHIAFTSSRHMSDLVFVTAK